MDIFLFFENHWRKFSSSVFLRASSIWKLVIPSVRLRFFPCLVSKSFTIFLAVFCAGMSTKNLTYFSVFFVLLSLGPIALDRLIVTFEGRFCLLTLSYLEMSDVLFGKRTLCGVKCRLSKMFCLMVFLSFFLYQKLF